MTTQASAAPISFRNILVATDLSSASVRSLPCVVAIARHYGSTVFIAHAIPLEIYGAARPQSFEAVANQARKGAQEKLDQFTAGIRAQGIQASTLLAEGDIGTVLPEWVSQHRIDLVAVGTTGRSGLRKLALGSIAEEIIRDAECPVLTAGPETPSESPAQLRSILCANDFSQDSAVAANYALSLAERTASRLILLHVRPERDADESAQAFRQQLSDLVASGTKLPVLPEVLVADGQPAEKILEVANQHGVDLIVIGVRGAGAFPRLASHFGSTAHDIVVRACCPVLTVRSPRAA